VRLSNFKRISNRIELNRTNSILSRRTVLELKENNLIKAKHWKNSDHRKIIYRKVTKCNVCTI
jgi:hypothetical protein